MRLLQTDRSYPHSSPSIRTSFQTFTHFLKQFSNDLFIFLVYTLISRSPGEVRSEAVPMFRKHAISVQKKEMSQEVKIYRKK